MKMRTILALVSVGVLALTAFARPPLKGPKSWVGKPLPKFSMKTIDGKTITNASVKGKVLFLDFWATWCGPCKAASPSVDALTKKYKSKGLVVVGATFQDAPGAAKKYQAEHKYSYAFAENADKLGADLGISQIPVFIVVDKKGIVRSVIDYYKKGAEKEFEAAIVAALK